MDTRLVIASKRDHRDFAASEVAEPEVRAILDAGRLAGSARNRQPWRFLVAREPATRDRIAAAVYVPDMIRRAPLVVALAVDGRGSAMGGFDAGRAAQNMMLAAWDMGIASCPNGISDPQVLIDALPLEPGETVAAVLAFGRPSRPRDATRRTVTQWSASARRLALDDLVVALDPPA